MTKPARIAERGSAVSEIAEAIRDRQHWLIGTTPRTIDRIADAMQESWGAVVYLDNATPVVLVGTSNTAKATALLMQIVGEVCAVFVIPKANTTAAELNTLFGPHGPQVPDDGSQDLVLFAEPLDDNHQIGYLPTLLEQAAYAVDHP